MSRDGARPHCAACDAHNRCTSLWDIATLSAPYRPNTSFDSIPYLISHHLSTISLDLLLTPPSILPMRLYHYRRVRICDAHNRCTRLWDIATLSAPYRPNTSFDSIPYLISHHLSTISLNIAPSHQVDRSAPLKIYKTPAAGGPHITELIGHDHTLRFTKLKLCS